LRVMSPGMRDEAEGCRLSRGIVLDAR